MSANMNQTFDPFSRHRGKVESQPDQPNHRPAEASAVDSKPVEEKSALRHFRSRDPTKLEV